MRPFNRLFVRPAPQLCIISAAAHSSAASKAPDSSEVVAIERPVWPKKAGVRRSGSRCAGVAGCGAPRGLMCAMEVPQLLAHRHRQRTDRGHETDDGTHTNKVMHAKDDPRRRRPRTEATNI